MSFSAFQNKGIFDPGQSKFVGNDRVSQWGGRTWVGNEPLTHHGGYDYLGDKRLTHQGGYDWVGNERVTYSGAGRPFIGNQQVFPWNPSR